MNSVVFLITFLIIAKLNAAEAKKNFELVYHDRYYLNSVLTELYGPEAKEILAENILKNGNLFGGSCDFYNQIRIGPNEYANEEKTMCFTGKKEFGYSPRAKPSLLRETWMMKTCNQLNDKVETFSFIKQKIKLEKIELSDIYTLQLLFDPNAVLNQKLNDYYIKKLNKLDTFDKKLKYLLKQICNYPSWQLI